MPISPESLFSSAGKKASGRRGHTDPNDKYGSNLVIAGRAEQRGMNMATPRLVRITIEAHKKEGGGTTRATFLALRIKHVPGRQDLIQLRGNWVLTADRFNSVYNVASMRKTDPLSKKSIDELREDTSIIDFNWPDNHIVAPSLCENSLALIHGVNALRHRALAASGCPGPKVSRLYPAIEGCSTRST